MNTPTPTSDPSGLGAATASPLDLGELTRLAGAFFAALPGQAPATTSHGGVAAPVNVLPGGSSPGPHANGPQLPGTIAPGANVAPAHPNSAANQVASAPALRPHSTAPNGLPDHAAIVPPALDSRLGQLSLAVPEGHAAALPRADVPAAPVHVPQGPSSPYYFLGESSAYSAPAGVGPTSAFYFIDPQAPGQARPSQATPRQAPFDVHAVRRDFPILQERVNGRQLVWFDNAATTHKPQSVIDRIAHFYQHENSNIHRAAHALAARATDAYEAAREKVRAFIGAGSTDEVIFVRGATEAINLVAKTWGAANVGEGDEIIVSNLEHHANIVPWQQLAAQQGARIRVIPVDDDGQVRLDEYRKLLNPRTKLVAVTQVSNALGTVVPVQEIVALAHAAGARVLVDGAQSVSHLRVDVRQLDADFFVFSGHKIFGPTGIGVVYGKRELLDAMPPWQGGGNMIADVTFERTLFQPPPNKFEAGTGNIADAVGLGAALDYVQRVGIENIARYEHDLLAYATHHLAPIAGVRLIGTAPDKASVLSFVLQGYTTEEVGKALNEEGIAVRSGHHCAQPILRRFGVEATVRPSLAFYNTCEEIDRFIAVIRRLSNGRR